jgi:hypothetical protein
VGNISLPNKIRFEEISVISVTLAAEIHKV